MDIKSHPYFVPADTEGTRQETAILLVGTAREFDIPQREIASTRGGYMISERVFEAVFGADVEVVHEDPTEDHTNTSGNRAAKKRTKEEE